MNFLRLLHVCFSQLVEVLYRNLLYAAVSAALSDALNMDALHHLGHLWFSGP